MSSLARVQQIYRSAEDCDDTIGDAIHGHTRSAYYRHTQIALTPCRDSFSGNAPPTTATNDGVGVDVRVLLLLLAGVVVVAAAVVVAVAAAAAAAATAAA